MLKIEDIKQDTVLVSDNFEITVHGIIGDVIIGIDNEGTSVMYSIYELNNYKYIIKQ